MRVTLRPFLACLALIVSPLLMYFSGLAGPFVFDDVPNLSPLGFHGGVTDWPTALYFIGSNESGPLGRPLSMASFLLDGIYWPADPYPFKYTNLLIHILNSLLVFWFFWLLLSNSRLEINGRVRLYGAFVAAMFWALHPMQVSAVLYVVQRMTLLSSSMILVGIIVFLKCRVMPLGRFRQLVLLLFLGGIGVVGVLFKETASLLVVYIAVLEVFLFRAREPELDVNGSWVLFRVGLFAGFFLFLLAMVVLSYPDDIWIGRSFTLWERLVTQSYILWEYLAQIILPRSSASGLFYDGHEVFSSFWLLLLCTLGFAVAFKLMDLMLGRVWAALILTWFLGGHILESTIIPLELYFEHRNYLPIMAAGLLIIAIMNRFAAHRLFVLSLFIYTVILLFVTRANVIIWSDENLMREYWALQSPNSKRAQQHLLNEMIGRGHYAEAERQLNAILIENPTDHHLNFQMVNLNCALKKEIDIEAFLRVLSAGIKTNSIHLTTLKLRDLIRGGHCAGLTLGDFDNILRALMKNRLYQDSRIQSFFYRGLAVNKLLVRDLDGAMVYFDAAYEIEPEDESIPLRQAAILASAGRSRDVLGYLYKACGGISYNPLKSPLQHKLINREAKRHGYWSNNEDFCGHSSKE